jgi:hypothetical protein
LTKKIKLERGRRRIAASPIRGWLHANERKRLEFGHRDGFPNGNDWIL